MKEIVALVSLVVQAMTLVAKLFKKSEKTTRREKLEDVSRAFKAAKEGDVGPLTDLFNR